MIENIRILITKHGLCLQFESAERKKQFISDMKAEGIDIFTEEPGTHCYIRHHSPENPVGEFLSEHHRVSLAFPSEQLKFFFKERIGLQSDCFMDMGPGYEAQIHFNAKVLPPIEGAAIMTTREIFCARP